jgi:hypothetical protein
MPLAAERQSLTREKRAKNAVPAIDFYAVAVSPQGDYER